MNYAQLLFPDFSLILCGYLLCRHTPLNRKIWEPVESLVYYFLFPVLLFSSIVKNPLNWGAASQLALAGLGLGIVAILLSYSWRHWPVLGPRIDARLHAASTQIGFRFNSFIALALVGKLAGSEGLLAMAVLIGVCVPLFNVGAVWPMFRHRQEQHPGGFARELVRNPLIIATTSGLLGNLIGLQFPDWIEPSVQRIGQSSLPLGLMAAGAGMRLGSLGQARLLAVLLLGTKHLALPLIALAMARLTGLGGTETLVLLMFSAVPTASSSYVLAARMGFDAAYVGALVTLSTLLGMASLPFALGLLAP